MTPWRHLRDYRSSIALENETFDAGSALACSFSSSDEFEAAIIAERRAAGMYDRTPWLPIVAGLAIVCAMVVLL